MATVEFEFPTGGFSGELVKDRIEGNIIFLCLKQLVLNQLKLLLNLLKKRNSDLKKIMNPIFT